MELHIGVIYGFQTYSGKFLIFEIKLFMKLEMKQKALQLLVFDFFN